MHRDSLLHLLLLLTAMLFPLAMQADERDFEHSVYQRTSELLHSHTYDENNLAVADSIYAASSQKGSLLGMLCANRLRMYVYVAQRDSANLIAATDEAISLAEQMEDTEAYTEAQNVRISFYIGQEHYFKAQQLTKEMLAKSAGSPVMLQQSYSLMANIYQNRDMQSVAITYYEKALAYVEEADSINRCLLYRNLAECHSLLEHHDVAIDYARRALDMAGTEGVYYYWSAFTYLYALFESKDYDAFLAEYNRIRLLEQPIDGLLPSYVQSQLRMRYEILQGNYAKALQLAESIDYKSLRIPAIIRVYRMWGNWQKTVEYLDLYNIYEDSVRTQMNMDAMLEVDAMMGLDRLKLEKQQLEVRNQRIILSSIILVFLIGLAALIFLLIRRRVHIRELNAKNEELEEKNQRLNRKNEELVEARDEAERSSQMKTRFMQSITHEIRTPLHAIAGFTQLLGEETSEEERREYVQQVVGSTSTVATMLSDMLLLSDLDSAAHKVRIEDIPATKLQLKAMETVQEFIPADVTFECPVELSDSVLVHADADLLNTALCKLIHNAVKFASGGKSITLACQLTPQGHIQYSVTDRGCGIPAEWSERIFERFVKVDEFIPGVGIGLTICREAVKTMGGSVVLDTGYTDGARFVIELQAGNA